jgi:hypothetical protein
MTPGRRDRRPPSLGFIAALALGLSACTNESPSLRLVSVVPPADTPISFSTDVQPIFDRSCTKGTGCHGLSPAQNLNLQKGTSYANLVGVPSTEVSALRVDPGMSASSYLIQKLKGTAPGDRMPADGPPFLPDGEVLVIETWIDQGAPNN